MRHQRRLSWFACALALSCAPLAQADVLISQVYGGGGNTGAPYRNDFIELFNAGNTSVNLSGWSVQYASSTGTSWQTTALSGSLAPGQYLLVQQAAGASTTAALLPTPDVTGTISMSGTAGKVALSNSSTALSGACPAAQNLVAFGTAANCPTPTATLSNTSAAIRKGGGCTNSGSNSGDFSALTPTPRNRSTTLNPCDGGGLPSNPSATASVSPSSLQVGESFLLLVAVQPGQNPASTGLVVVANLGQVGGSTSQLLYDDGTHGDLTAGDKIFSVAGSVAAGTTAGSKTLGIGVGDDQLRSASLNASLSIVQLVAIHAVQGTGSNSPYLGQAVVVEGIVTARKSNGFFLQAADADADDNAASSEAIMVFTSSTPPATAAVGNRVRVSGNVAEFVSSSNPHQWTLTEIVSPVISQLGSGNALPTPVQITSALSNAGSPLDNLERLEAMRVTVPALKVVAPVGAFVTEATAVSTSNGVFFGVIPGVARPFREPGVGALDATVFPIGVDPQLFDTNPERIRVQSTGQVGSPAMGVDVGDSVSGLVGVLDYGFGAYSLLPDPSAAIAVTPGSTPTAVSVAKHNEITMGGFNLQRFFDSTNAAGISDPVLTPETLAKRLKKTANAICGYVRTPDILGVVEVENLDVLDQLAASINTGDTQTPGTCAKNPQYQAHLLEGNDIGGIDVGFLVTSAEVAPGVPRVEVLEIIQLGKDETLINPNGSSTLLNDRPSLLLRARIHQANGAHYDVTVVSNHLRSLSDANSMAPRSDGWGTDGARVRAKRAAQAKSLAQFVHARQQANPAERIVLLGDFNAFEFNDGYTDSMGVITGREAAPGAVLNYVDSPITTPLTNLADLSPAADRYSFSFDGNAQSLDHMVVNQALLDNTASVRAEHARINSDFGEDNYGDFSVPVRVSDHDPVVLFLNESSFSSVDLAASVSAAQASVVIGQVAGFGVGVSNAGPDAAGPVSLDLTLNAPVAAMQVTPAGGWTCSAPVVDGAQTRSRCGKASMASAGSDSFVVLVPTSRDLGGRTLILAASIASPMTDLAPANNAGQASTQVTASADMMARVIIPRGPLQPGKLAAFGIAIANRGPHDARAPLVAISVNAPRSVVTAISADGFRCSNLTDTASSSTWACASSEAFFASGRVQGLAVTVNPSFANGPVISVGATIASETTDPVAGNNTDAGAVRVAR